MEQSSFPRGSGFILARGLRGCHGRSCPSYGSGALQRRTPCGLDRRFVCHAAHAGSALLRPVHFDSRSRSSCRHRRDARNSGNLVAGRFCPEFRSFYPEPHAREPDGSGSRDSPGKQFNLARGRDDDLRLWSLDPVLPGGSRLAHHEQVADKPLAEKLLLRAQTLDPKGKYSYSLGRLYALTLLGSNSSMPLNVVRSVSA